MKGYRYGPAAGIRKGGLGPIVGFAGSTEFFDDGSGNIPRTSDLGYFNQSALIFQIAADMGGQKNVGIRRHGYLSGSSAGPELGLFLIKIIIRHINHIIFGIIFPIADQPDFIVVAGNLFGRNIGMHQKQRVGTLGIVQLKQLISAPGRFQLGNTPVVFENFHLIITQAQQINLLGIKLEGKQAGRLFGTADIF